MSLVLSVEETNRLRERVGLRPIPVPSTWNNGKQLSKQGGSESKAFLIELSVQETNLLRKKIGLKPIPEDDRDLELQNYAALQKNAQETENVANLKSKLDKTKNEMKNYRRLASGSILDRISRGKTAALDFDTWLDKIGSEVKIENIKKLRFKSPKQQTQQVSDPTDIKIAHDKGHFSEELTKVNQIVLTAKDVNVLDDVNDEFENNILRRETQIKSTHKANNDKGKLITLENDQETDGFVLKNGDKIKNSVKRQLESLALDIDDSASEDEGKKICKFMKRDVSKFKRSKQSVTKRRTFDTVPVSKEFKPLKLDESDDEERVDELEKLLEKQRKSIFSKSRTTSATKDDKNETNGEIFDERLDFIENFQVDDDRNSKQEVSAHAPTQNEIHDIGISIGSSRYRKLLESEENKHNTLGVSEILSVLKSNGKQEKRGSESAVDITYTDDDGNILSTKDAFKYMSRKFHGFKKK